MERLQIPVVAQVPIQITTFRSEVMSKILQLVRVKHKVMLKVLAHEHALTEISCPGLMNITKALIDRGLILADKHITSDTLWGWMF